MTRIPPNIHSERTSSQKAHVVKAWAIRACFTNGLLGGNQSYNKYRMVPPFLIMSILIMSKKYFLWSMFAIMMVAITSVGFVSCSSDSDDDDSMSIVGVWYETQYWKDNSWKSSGSSFYYIFEFKSNNTYNVYLTEDNYKTGKTLLSGTYTFDGNNLTLDGGFKHPVSFSENGQSVRIEEYYTLRRYSGGK